MPRSAARRNAKKKTGENMRYVSFVILWFAAVAAMAQEATVAGGGTAAKDGAEVSFSIGQAIAVYAEDDVMSMLAGVQQPCDFIQTYVPQTGADGLEGALYPNPVVSVLNVECSKATAECPFTLRIYDERGAYAASHEVAASHVEIDMSGMPVGVYLFVMTDAAGVMRGYFKVVKV